MTKYIGRLKNIGFAKETVRGTAVAVAHWLAKAKVTFFDHTIKHKEKLSYGVIGDGAYAPKVIEWSEGQIDGDFLDKPFGLILLAAFGTLQTTGPSDSAYTHTFSLANTAQHQSLTITLQDPDRTDQYALAVLDSLQLDVKPDDVVTFSAGFKSKTGRAVAGATPSYVAVNKFLGRHVNIKLATLASGLGAASNLSIKSLQLKINKNSMLNNILGTVQPDDILNGKFEINGQLELDLDDQTYRQLMLDGSYRAMRIAMVNSDVLLGATSQPAFTLDLSRVHFEAWEPVVENDALVTQKIAFTALFDITNSNIINSCTLVNAQASY